MRVGASVKNLRTGTTFTVLASADDSLTLKYESEAPTRTPDFPKHFHERWVEEFEIVKGRGRYWYDGDWHDAAAGETLRHEPGHPHVHPINSGDEPFEMIQTVRSAIPDPEGIQSTIAALYTLIDRHAAGRVAVTSMGYPVNPLYFAALGRALGQSASYDAAIPVLAQKAASATMGRLAIAMGVNPIDDKWL